ncbi:MAG: ABC transporter ATP-binding protein, partial [Bacteroidetes bacterium]|nr:ABC transporter ATP-binding protein [Bacteroidota bacterium]
VNTTQSNDNVQNHPQKPFLIISGLNVQILDTTILHSIQFNLSRGVITGLIGPNGCGKTTLLRAICGYLPYTGSILLEEQEVRKWPRKKLARKISFVRQAPQFSFDFTVEELVLLGLLPHKSLLENISRQDHGLLESVLGQVGLSGYNKRSLQSLSGGERQRAYLAQAILQNSELLLLDEPTTHLDICHQYQFLEMMKNLADHGKTVLVVFHDLELAAKFSDRLVVLNHGHLVTTDTPLNVLNRELLSDIFRMHATVEKNSSEISKINYESSMIS